VGFAARPVEFDLISPRAVLNVRRSLVASSIFRIEVKQVAPCPSQFQLSFLCVEQPSVGPPEANGETKFVPIGLDIAFRVV